MDKLSRQDVLNLSHSYYANGGRTGFNGHSCLYFSADGGRCSVGVILDHLGISRGDLNTDERDYNENCDAADVVKFLGERLTDHLEPDVFAIDNAQSPSTSMFLMRMQTAHDIPAQGGVNIDVAGSLQDFAVYEGLASPE